MVEGIDSATLDGEVIDMAHLVLMANQIGDFFATYPPERAREGLRNHLRTYWDPRMRTALLRHVDAGGEGNGWDSGLAEGGIVILGFEILVEADIEFSGVGFHGSDLPKLGAIAQAENMGFAQAPHHVEI